MQSHKQQNRRGRLKVFLGYAPGVGKTCAMLEAGRSRRNAGAAVAVGYVETGSHPDVQPLLAGIPFIPCRRIEIEGAIYQEMDLESILARQPEIVLVDQLAHSNAPGSRHTKRYHDVIEILDNGIDVYTTLNIQHLESVKDIVSQITGIIVSETVPDHLLNGTAEIELVDLPVDELLARVKAGKVSWPQDMAQTPQKFFRPGNLNALREMALRRTADSVDEQMRHYMRTHAISGPWPAAERILVCVGPSPLSERLVRTASRLASRLNAELIALYVEISRQSHLTKEERDRVAGTLRLAEELGAQTVTVTGRSVAKTIAVYAREQNITKIVAGRSLPSRWTDLLQGSTNDQIIRHSQNIDVYVISNHARQTARATSAIKWPLGVNWRRYGYSTLVVLIVTLLGLPLRSFIEPTNLVMLYLAAVMWVAIRWGRYPAIWASVLCTVVFDLVFVPPYYTFIVDDAQYILTFLGLLGAGIIISTLVAQAREQEEAARRRERQTAALYGLSQKLTSANRLQEIAEGAVEHIFQTTGRPTAIFLWADGQLRLQAQTPALQLEEAAKTVAAWVYQHNQPAGHHTDTSAHLQGYFLPLTASQGVVGVLVVYPGQGEQSWPSDERRLLFSFAGHIGLAVERALLAEKAKQVQLLHETERLHTALLNSISHDLRTPLASITGVLSSLREDAVLLDEAAKSELVNTAWDETDRLNRLVGNLLDMTRLESGTMKVAQQLGDLEDLVGVALKQMGPRVAERPIHTDLPATLPLVRMDFVLMVQVLANLLDNAAKYSPAGTAIKIQVREDQNEIIIAVTDEGGGLPDGELDPIFDKFYRVKGLSQVGGTGLGLSICKGIVEAHNGRIWAENQPDGGLTVFVALKKERGENSGAQHEPDR